MSKYMPKCRLKTNRAAVLGGLPAAGCLCLLIFAGSCASTTSPTAENTTGSSANVDPTDSRSLLLVGSQTITCDDIMSAPVENNGTFVSLKDSLRPIAQINTYEHFKVWARPSVERIINDRILEIFLYEQAKRQTPDNFDETLNKVAEKELRRFIISFGGDEAKADEALKQMGIDRKTFIQQQKKLILTKSYISTKIPLDKPPTYRELLQCYNEMKEAHFVIPAMIRFRLIDIQPARLPQEQPQQDALEAARQRANELVERIRAGEDFAELTGQYSHGGRREFGGLWNPMQPNSLAEPYDALANAAKTIEPGQIAGPIEVPGHIFIMKLEEKRKKNYEPFAKVQEQLEQKIISDRRREASNSLPTEITEQVPQGDKERFIEFCLERFYYLKENPPVKPGG